MAAVEFMLPALREMLPQYELIGDCVAGEVAVKKARTKYLPHPTPADVSSPEAVERYNGYITRAVFYNTAQKTLNGLVGLIFVRPPQAKVPTLLDIVVNDVDGAGVKLDQQAKDCATFVLSKGRAGIYVDYPEMENGKAATLLDVQQGNIRPTIALYKPEAIINWRTTSRGAKKLLSLVVLVEQYTKEDDGFETKYGTQWRVLRLDAQGLYTVTIYRDEAPDAVYKTYNPVDANGKRLDEIPFLFVGVTKNDTEIDLPPLYDLCSVNLAHYRNSADYEEHLFITGQATPVLTGLTQEWVTDVLKGTVVLGSRAAIPLPANASAELLQADERTGYNTAMEAKEKQMKGLGAKLVEDKSVQRTATEAAQDEASETSVLSATAKNVGAAYKWALEWAAIFVGLKDRTAAATDTAAAIEYDVNSEFDLTKMTSDELKTVLSLWQGELITEEEARDNLTRSGIATLAYEDFKTQIESERTAALARMAAETAAQTIPDPANPDPAAGNTNNGPNAGGGNGG